MLRVGGKKCDLEFLFKAEMTNSDPINQAGNVKGSTVGWWDLGDLEILTASKGVP